MFRIIVIDIAFLKSFTLVFIQRKDIILNFAKLIFSIETIAQMDQPTFEVLRPGEDHSRTKPCLRNNFMMTITRMFTSVNIVFGL